MEQQIEARQAVLDFIVQFKAKHDGLSPTYEAIGEKCGLGKTTVKHHVDKLIADGKLVSGPGHWGLIVPGGQWVPPFEVNALPEVPRAGNGQVSGQNLPFTRPGGPRNA